MSPESSSDFYPRKQTMKKFLPRLSEFQNWVESWRCGYKQPLFRLNEDKSVHFHEKEMKIAKKSIKLLSRSVEMETAIISATNFVLDEEKYGGLLYLIYTIQENDHIALIYSGIAGKFGRDGKSISSNLKNIKKNREFFARWGDDSARHMGGLSNATFDNSFKIERKYWRFKDALFDINQETGKVFLKQPTYFAIKAISAIEMDYSGEKLPLKELESKIIREFHPQVNYKMKKIFKAR